ncbi:uncharacterized protein At2g27730, mitochondrial-like isoform X3 [Salvia splendens]|uniref:uncharacterized protein At2g27730, mitochondrial-like isoform X3 n=1 Tax=Salvia splendens TaxID=180675 RepID=UPI001C27AB8C|nr:uncharacterized protein At2g27730, mitochondrial-like isoform X3 [Salvia splendens]
MALTSLASRAGLIRIMEGNLASSTYTLRYFSDGKGRVLSEEERAKETVYIQKMERERLEKQKKKAELEKTDKGKSDKAAEDTK